METFRLIVEIFSGIVSFLVVVNWAFTYLEKKGQKLDRQATISLSKARPKSPYNEDRGIYRIEVAVKPGKDPTIFDAVSAKGCLVGDIPIKDGKYQFEKAVWRQKTDWLLKVNTEDGQSIQTFFVKTGKIDDAELTLHIKKTFLFRTLKRTLFLTVKL